VENVILIKLTTSEEIIASQVDEWRSDVMVLSKARSLIPTENGLVMLPWILGSEDPSTKYESEVEIQKTAIIGRAITPPKALIDHYLQKVSGIDFATGT